MTKGWDNHEDSFEETLRREMLKYKGLYLNDKKDEPVFRNLEESEFNDIERKFKSIAEKVASWHPSDAISTNYYFGNWCKFCDFQATCSEFR